MTHDGTTNRLSHRAYGLHTEGGDDLSNELKSFLSIRSIGQAHALQAGFDFIEAMRKIQAMAGTSQEEFSTLSKDVLDMAKGECEECGGPCRWEYAGRYGDDEEAEL